MVRMSVPESEIQAYKDAWLGLQCLRNMQVLVEAPDLYAGRISGGPKTLHIRNMFLYIYIYGYVGC